MNIKIDMRNPFQEETLMKMLAWMEFCGNIGHCTSFQTIFDGDGTAKIHCNFETEELQEKYSAIRKDIRDDYNKGHKEPDCFEFGL